MAKKRKIGFTLIELMGIIIILSLLSLLVIPGIDHAIKQFKDEAYESQLKNIKLAATDWTIDNVPKYALNDGDAITITLAQLKMSNLVEEDITNPKTDAPFADDMIINIIRQNNSFNFDVDSDSGVVVGLSDNAPVLTLNGPYVVRMYEDFGYVDQGATAKTSTGVVIPSTSITKIITKNGTVVPSITDMVGTYTISYSVTHSGITRMIYRVIIFEQLQPATPEVCFTFNPVNGQITNYNRDLAGCGYNVVIPRTIGGVTVTSIGYSAFMFDYLTSVTFPSSITDIGARAFRFNDLKSLMIPSSVTSIGDEAFYFNELTSVSIPTSITSIGVETFAYNYLSSISIPTSITLIGDYAFFANQLTSLTIPNNVTSIGIEAFAANQLKSVSIPTSLTSIATNAFSANQLTSVTIPSSVTSIGEEAFYDNQLTSVTIQNGVTSIGNNAFSFNNLSSVTIPNSVTSIGVGAFSINELSSVSIGTGVTTIAANTFLSNQIESVTIPSNVTSIGIAAFKFNQLESVTIPNSVTSIGSEAFKENILGSVDIGTGVTTIGNYTFDTNNILQGSAIIRRASGTVTIGTGAFNNNGATGTTTITPTYVP